jgi:hypothetical protein
MPVCPDCRRSYKHSHRVCQAGTCHDCLALVQDLGAHRCPIRKVLSTDLVDAWARIQDSMTRSIACWACETRHFLNKNIHGFRKFWNVDLCYDCYNIPQIMEHVRHMRRRLLIVDANKGKWRCSLCEVSLFDPVTLQPHRAFERDHLDVFAKTTTVWELVVTGASFERITAENDKCRNLCIRCHSAVTCAERTCGILRLKVLDRTPLRVTPYTKKRALYQVETLTDMLLEHTPGPK